MALPWNGDSSHGVGTVPGGDGPVRGMEKGELAQTGLHRKATVESPEENPSMDVARTGRYRR